ncbi:transporter substrate-binding domain-containing protein [Paenibacillus sp. KN14-4R]|uniref:transporter substrate-binding domain-containing protein n=1 Tax=Paenibacillus sp. KN14-4R TaxID=3445773 RepID=UPI003F9F8FB4
MKHPTYRPYSLLIILTLFAVILSACGADKAAGTAGQDSAKESKEPPAKKVLRVGTSGIYPPFVSKGKDQKLEGYDVDVLNLVGEKLGYQIEWTVAEFSGLFGMMDSGRIDTIANLIAVTDERKKKYDFTDPYAYYSVTLVVKNDRDDIKSMQDLKGKNLGALLGNNMHNYATKWNKENGNEINIKAYQDVSGTYQEVALGRIDAFIDSNFVAHSRIKAEGLPLKIFSKTPLYTTENAFPFVRNKENEAFIKQFSKALQELKDEGKLKALSDKWSEIDVTKP